MKREVVINITYPEMVACQDILDGNALNDRITVKDFTAYFDRTDDGYVAIKVAIVDNGKGPEVESNLIVDGSITATQYKRNHLHGQYVFGKGLKDTYIAIIPDVISETSEDRMKYNFVEARISNEQKHILDTIYANVLLKSDHCEKSSYELMEEILEECANNSKVLDIIYKYYTVMKREQSSTLEEVKIYRDKRGDDKCPNCSTAREDLEMYSPDIKHNNTELHIPGYCPDCGCSFTFVYVLHLSDVIRD